MRKISALLLAGLLFGSGLPSDAQVLQGLGRKVEKKLADRVDRKVDRSVDKVLDKADRETDKPLDDALNNSGKSKKAKEPKEKASKNTEKAGGNAAPQTPSEGAVASQPVGEWIRMADDCSDFIWFKTGAMMEFEALDGNMKPMQRSKMTVGNVRSEALGIVADVLASDDKDNAFEMQFRCAGDKMYMDFGAVIRAAMQKAGDSGAQAADIEKAMENTEIGFSDGFMAFPKRMRTGERLDDVSVTIKSSPTPQVSMAVVSTLGDRVVVGTEKMATPAGSFDCVKIKGVRRTSMNMMGMNNKMPESTEVTWFAPGIGVVKQENYDHAGKLESVSRLVAYQL